MSIQKLCLCGLFSALMALCAWICLPVGPMLFTLQTFGIFLALFLLGGKWGSISIGVYLLLGAVGLPVFSGFRGGIGMLLGATGGYLLGFLLTGLVYWGVFRLTKQSLASALCGLLACYAFGAFWYWHFYLQTSFWTAVATCVLPYLIPDGIKLFLALLFAKRLKRFV